MNDRRALLGALEAKMTEQGVKLLRTPAEVVDALRILLPTNIPGFDGYQVLRALRSRIAPPAPRHEGLRERIKEWKRRYHEEPLKDAKALEADLFALLRDCLAAFDAWEEK